MTNRIEGTLHLVNICCFGMCLQLGIGNRRTSRDKTEGRAGKEYSLFVHLRKRRKAGGTCAVGQSSHISLTDCMRIDRSICLLSSKRMVRLRPPKWHLEMAWFRLLEIASSRPGSSNGDKSWERTITVKDNKVHHRSTWKRLLLQTPTHIGIRNKNGL